MNIKASLKKLLHDRDMTVAQLSRATKVPVQTLSNWLQGLKPRDLEQVQRVSAYFGVTLDFFVSGKESEAKPAFNDYKEEINAGVYEVILRKLKKESQ